MTTIKLNLNFFTDPGHGWLEVPHTIVRELGLTPTPYSYRNAEFAYLEEDCDAHAFMEAAKARGFEVALKVIDEPTSDSFVRSLPRY